MPLVVLLLKVRCSDDDDTLLFEKENDAGEDTVAFTTTKFSCFLLLGPTTKNATKRCSTRIDAIARRKCVLVVLDCFIIQ